MVLHHRHPISSHHVLASERRGSASEKRKRLLEKLHRRHTEGKKRGEATMEVDWIADRATLRSLAREHPEWTQQDLAEAVGRSFSWGKPVAEAIARGSGR